MEIKEEIKFKIPEVHFNISTPAAIIIGAAIMAGTIIYTDSPLNLRSRGYNTNNNQAVVGQNEQQAEENGDGTIIADVTLGDMPFLGEVNAPVEIVEWADYQCPFCKKFFTEVESRIVDEYVNKGVVKFAYRDFAFLGEESFWASNATRCANDQGKFWQYHDYLFNNQGGENIGSFSKDNLKKFGATLGLNTAQFNACVDSDQHKAEVEADVQAGQDAGVSGTPATFVNGKLISGAQAYETFKKEIDDALAGF